MIVTRKIVELSKGVACELLVTPALYGVAARRGIDLTSDANAGGQGVFVSYIKMMYCAAVNAWEVKAVDSPEMGAFPYKYSEFDAWAWEGPKRFIGVVTFMYEALTGRSLKEGAIEEKKKRK